MTLKSIVNDVNKYTTINDEENIAEMEACIRESETIARNIQNIHSEIIESLIYG